MCVTRGSSEQDTVRFDRVRREQWSDLDGAFADRSCPGDTVVRGELFVPDWKLWILENPSPLPGSRHRWRESLRVSAINSPSDRRV